MDPKFSTSFIPKKTLGVRRAPLKPRSDTFYYISLVLFAASLLGAGAMFGWAYLISGSIAEKETALENARAAFEPARIEEFKRLDARLTAAKELISRHAAISTVFTLLEEATPEKLGYADLDYASNGEEGIVLKLSGSAASYNTLALAARLFEEDPSILSASFSDLSLDDDGDVSFTVEAVVAPELVSYEALIAPTLTPEEDSTATSTEATSTTEARTDASENGAAKDTADAKTDAGAGAE